jgi:endoglucanase
MSKTSSLLAAFLVAGLETAHAATPVELHGPLKVVGTKMVDSSGAQVQLKGMSLFWSGWAGQFYNRRAIHWLAHDWKTSVVRAAMGVEGGGNYLDSANKGDAANLRRVDSVVQASIDLGIYVIIDWHDHDAPDHQAKAVEFFQRMARKWGGYPNVLYEIYNEPHGAMAADPVTGAKSQAAWTWPQVKAYSIAVIDSIRAIDPDNIILVGTPTWAQDVDVAARSPITGRTNLVYTLHFYAGTHGASLRTRAETAMKTIPLFITEWGTSAADGGGGDDRMVYWSESMDWLDWADSRSLSWCNWSVVSKDESSAALKPGASPKGWWPDSMLSESGWYVRDRLISQGKGWAVEVPLADSLLADTSLVPGRIQAESFFASKGVDVESGVDEDGTENIGWIESGDWTEYVAKVPEAGSWYLHARVASRTLGGRIVVSVGGAVVETLEVAGTGGWQKWVTTVSDAKVSLPAGLVRVRLDFVGDTASLFNLNWLELSDNPSSVRGRAPRAAGMRVVRKDGLLFVEGARGTWSGWTLRDVRGGTLSQGEFPMGTQGSGIPAPTRGGLAILELRQGDARAILPVALLP